MVRSISFRSPHVCTVWALSTCGEPNEIKEIHARNTSPLLLLAQGHCCVVFGGAEGVEGGTHVRTLPRTVQLKISGS